MSVQSKLSIYQLSKKERVRYSVEFEERVKDLTLYDCINNVRINIRGDIIVTVYCDILKNNEKKMENLLALLDDITDNGNVKLRFEYTYTHLGHSMLN